jgi:hypothetical protein
MTRREFLPSLITLTDNRLALKLGSGLLEAAPAGQPLTRRYRAHLTFEKEPPANTRTEKLQAEVITGQPAPLWGMVDRLLGWVPVVRQALHQAGHIHRWQVVLELTVPAALSALPFHIYAVDWENQYLIIEFEDGAAMTRFYELNVPAGEDVLSSSHDLSRALAAVDPEATRT